MAATFKRWQPRTIQGIMVADGGTTVTYQTADGTAHVIDWSKYGERPASMPALGSGVALVIDYPNNPGDKMYLRSIVATGQPASAAGALPAALIGQPASMPAQQFQPAPAPASMPAQHAEPSDRDVWIIRQSSLKSAIEYLTLARAAVTDPALAPPVTPDSVLAVADMFAAWVLNPDR